jgi:hypothetical protein
MTATRHWKWIGAESMDPYWVVSRWTIAELRKWQTVDPTSTVRFNMDVAHVQRMALSVSCSSHAIAHSVIVPILTNTVALRKGDQLRLEVVPKAVTKKRKFSYWKTDALKSKAADPHSRSCGCGMWARWLSRSKERGRHDGRRPPGDMSN